MRDDERRNFSGLLFGVFDGYIHGLGQLGGVTIGDGNRL